jgi:hypothetical protein
MTRRVILLVLACGVTATVLLLRYFSQGVLVKMDVSTKVVNFRVSSADWPPDPDFSASSVELWGPFEAVRFSSGAVAGCNGYYSADERGILKIAGKIVPVQINFTSGMPVRFAYRGPGLVEVSFLEASKGTMHLNFDLPEMAWVSCESCRCYRSSQVAPAGLLKANPGSSVEVQAQGSVRITAAAGAGFFRPFAVRNVSFVDREDGEIRSALATTKNFVLVGDDQKKVEAGSLLEMRPRSGTEIEVQEFAVGTSDLHVVADGHMQELSTGGPTGSRNLIPLWWFRYGHPWLSFLYLGLGWIDKAWEFVKKNLSTGKEIADLTRGRKLE